MDTPTPSGRRIARWVGGAAVIGAACALVIVIVRQADPEPPARRPAPAAAAPAPGRPVRPPGPNDRKPEQPPGPKLPALSARERAQLAEQVRGSKQPGRDAFRAVSDRYVEENLDLATRQAATEGITLAEVRELTYFGLLVLATQRFEEVEAVTGRPLGEAARDGLAGLMQSANTEFRDAMRALVRSGGDEAARWALIRDTQARYQAELFRLSGLTELLLDDLLAGNLALPGAPASGPPPQGSGAAGPRDDLTPRPRPDKP